jgi:hypothetical protein
MNKALINSFAKVFGAAALAQFIALGGDVFSVDADGVKTIISSAIAAVAVVAYNYLSPSDTRYGVGSDDN